MYRIRRYAYLTRTRAFRPQIADRNAVHRISGAVDISGAVSIAAGIIAGGYHTRNPGSVDKSIKISINRSIGCGIAKAETDIYNIHTLCC